jgi:hypothetical protein
MPKLFVTIPYCVAMWSVTWHLVIQRVTDGIVSHFELSVVRGNPVHELLICAPHYNNQLTKRWPQFAGRKLYWDARDHMPSFVLSRLQVHSSEHEQNRACLPVAPGHIGACRTWAHRRLSHLLRAVLWVLTALWAKKKRECLCASLL